MSLWNGPAVLCGSVLDGLHLRIYCRPTGNGHGRGLHFHGGGGEQAAAADQYAPHPGPPGPREDDSVGGRGPQAVEETRPTVPHKTHQL